MIKGSTVIFNNDYIEELIRHRDNFKKKFEVEDLPEYKNRAEEQYIAAQNKLDWACDFRDTIDHFVNLDVPSITGVVTISGYELPAKHLQIV